MSSTAADCWRGPWALTCLGGIASASALTPEVRETVRAALTNLQAIDHILKPLASPEWVTAVTGIQQYYGMLADRDIAEMAECWQTPPGRTEAKFLRKNKVSADDLKVIHAVNAPSPQPAPSRKRTADDAGVGGDGDDDIDIDAILRGPGEPATPAAKRQRTAKNDTAPDAVKPISADQRMLMRIGDLITQVRDSTMTRRPPMATSVVV